MKTIKFSRHFKPITGKLDMAPLVDVVLNLLVYFMLTSSFIMQPGMHIRLPEARTTEAPLPKPITVSITAENQIFLEDRQVTLNELEEMITDLGKRGSFELLVQGDELSRHGLVVRVLDIARLAGADKLVVATTPEL